jgi:hypothetical protein
MPTTLEVRSQPHHRLKFNRIDQRVTLMQGKPGREGKPKAQNQHVSTTEDTEYTEERRGKNLFRHRFPLIGTDLRSGIRSY